MARKKRNQINEEDYDLLEPLDVLNFGSDDDPCFGKLHDLAAKECKICGDSEFCAIVKSQNLHKERKAIETKQRFKDIEEEENDRLKLEKELEKEILFLQEKGYKRLKIVIKLSKKHNIPKETIKNIINKM